MPDRAAPGRTVCHESGVRARSLLVAPDPGPFRTVTPGKVSAGSHFVRRTPRRISRMFDLVFQGAAAVNQAMLLLMALGCMGLGAALLGYEIHWRLRAARVTGTIIGVREMSPNMYRTVYEYNSPTGSTVEATSSIGSNSLRGRAYGRRVELLVFADRPEDVSEAGAIFAGALGAIFFLAGLWPLHSALTGWPVTPLTWIMLAAGIAVIAHRMRSLLIPKSERKGLTAWRQERREKVRAALAAVPIRRMEDILAAPEFAERRQRDEKTYRWLRPLLLVVGIGALAFAVHLGQGVMQLEHAGLRADGVVVGLAEDRGSDSSTYRAVVRFTTRAGATLEFQDRIGSSPPSYHVGEKVTVLYASATPADSATIDRGTWNWLPPVALGAFGCFMLFVSLRAMARPSTSELRLSRD